MNILTYLKSNKELMSVLSMFDPGDGFIPILIDKNFKDINIDIQEIKSIDVSVKSIDVSDEMNGNTTSTFCLIINNKYYLCFIDKYDNIVGSFPTAEEDNAFFIILEEIKQYLNKKVNLSRIKLKLKNITLSHSINKDIFYHGSPVRFNNIDKKYLSFSLTNDLLIAGTYATMDKNHGYIYKIDVSKLDIDILDYSNKDGSPEQQGLDKSTYYIGYYPKICSVDNINGHLNIPKSSIIDYRKNIISSTLFIMPKDYDKLNIKSCEEISIDSFNQYFESNK